MSEGLDKLTSGIGEAIKTVPEIYDDGLKSTAQESGKTLALIPRTINAALAPLRQWIAQKEYNVAETEKLLAQKLEHVGEDKIVTPDAYVAVPAIQAISYSMNSEELRNLYANLLAKAMNSDTKDMVHPAFVEIVKQMSPMDAKIFSIIMQSPVQPLMSIVVETKNNGGYHLFSEYCSWIPNISLNQCRVAFNNLSRLGLIEIPLTESYVNENVYDPVKQNPLFIEAEKECINSLHEGEKINYIYQYIKISGISDLFYSICVKDL